MLDHRSVSDFDERMRHAANSVLQLGGRRRVPAVGRVSHGGAMSRWMSGRKLPRARGDGGSHVRSTLRRTARVRWQATAQLPGSNVSRVWFTLTDRFTHSAGDWHMTYYWRLVGSAAVLLAITGGIWSVQRSEKKTERLRTAWPDLLPPQQPQSVGWVFGRLIGVPGAEKPFMSQSGLGFRPPNPPTKQ